MGRARGATQATAVSGFDGVLGPRRGLQDGAQALRDADELVERERYEQRQLTFALDRFVGSICAESGGDGAIAIALAAAYCEGDHLPQSDGYAEFMSSLLALGGEAALGEMALIAAYGDPEECPGLTAPVVEALGQGFARAQDSNLSGWTFDRVRCENLLGICFATGPDHDEAYYTRLEALAQGLGQFMVRQPMRSSSSIFLTVAKALGRAPAAAIAGPLRSWIEPLTLRIDDDAIAPSELEALALTLADRADARDPSFLAAFAPLLARVSPEAAAERARLRAER